MILRTYHRRNKVGRSLSDGGHAYDGIGSSGAQDSPWSSSQDLHSSDPSPYSFRSSQESCWSQSDYYGSSALSLHNSRGVSNDDDSGEEIPSGIFSRQTSLEGLALKIQDGKPAIGSKRKSCREGALDSSRKDLAANGSGSSSWRKGTEGMDLPNLTSQWAAPSTSTLLEAQESGEMMEHVDEANFALDGLRPGQPLRIQRASLASLLSLCGSLHKRRLLRSQGMAKPLMEAIVALPTDDPALALAAAAVLYFLTRDCQDEDLLDSPPFVRFLMKLLGAVLPQPKVKKGLNSIGTKLAALGSKSCLQKTGTTLKTTDRGGAVVVAKVHALMQSSKEHSSTVGNRSEDSGLLHGEEISSKMLALLTLEKACISTVVLEDSTGESIRKEGGRFKERLRELGGLDAICELASNCLINLTEDLEAEQSRDILDGELESPEKRHSSGGATVLLRCLRVMENVTFLSPQNQKHLLELKLSKGNKVGPYSFIGLTIDAIQTLSELSMKKKERKKDQAEADLHGEEQHSGQDEICALAGNCMSSNPKGKKQSSCIHSSDTAIIKDVANDKPSTFGKATSLLIKFQRREVAKFPLSNTTEDLAGSKKKPLISMASKHKPFLSDIGLPHRSKTSSEHKCSSKTEVESVVKGVRKRKMEDVNDSQDPFGFDEVDLEFNAQKPPRIKSKKPQAGRTSKPECYQVRVGASRDDVAELDRMVSGDKSKDMASRESSAGQAESPREALFGDCLLSAVRVLMNLTNDNPVGCRQVAACGGMSTAAQLLIAHYPWPKDSEVSTEGMESDRVPVENRGIQSDQDLDILTVVLGMLCNLVEKDTINRARLATLTVAVPENLAETKEGVLWQDTGIIALLCSLFLIKQGAGAAIEATESRRALEMDVEAAVKQGQAEAEHMIVEAYVALLLGFLSKESERARETIAQLLPGDDLTVLVPVLERFVAFHLSINAMAAETILVVRDLIESLKRPLSSRPVS